jgi:hypothetical protein
MSSLLGAEMKRVFIFVACLSFLCDMLYCNGRAETLWESEKYYPASIVDRIIIFPLNKLSTGPYHLTVLLNPFDIEKLRNNNVPIKFEYTAKIQHGEQTLLERKFSFSFERAITGSEAFLFDVPRNIFWANNLELSIIDIKFDNTLIEFYEFFSFQLDRYPRFYLR